MIRLAALAVAAALVSGYSGCRLFDPAEPEVPTGTTIVGDYSHQDSTLASIAVAIRAKGNSGSRDVYERAFADTTVDPRGFVALFDAVTRLRYESQGQTIPDPWTRDQERVFYAAFVSTRPGLAFDMRWSEGEHSDVDRSSENLYIAYRKYEIFYRKSDGEVVKEAEGFAEIHLIQTQSRWLVARWFDKEDVDPQIARSYGQLRLDNQ